jgi:hypothetical protein
MNLSPLPSITQYAFYGPPSTYAPSYFVHGAPEVLCPLSHRHGLACQSKTDVSALVIGLRFLREPFAIGLLVVPLVIKTLDAFCSGSLSHIFKKVGEVMPSITDFYSSAPVVAKCWVASVFAPLNHVSPNSVGACFRQAVLEGPPLCCTTSARSSIPSAKRTGKHGHDISARTLALPPSSCEYIFWNATNRGEFSERVSNLDASRHGGVL